MTNIFKPVTIQKTGLDVTCHRCSYRWVYCGSRKGWISCSNCHTTVTLDRKRVKEALQSPEVGRHVETVARKVVSTKIQESTQPNV